MQGEMKLGTPWGRRADGLTERQAEVLRAIYEITNEAKRAPTIREVCERMGYASSTAVAGPNGFREVLRKRGWLRADAGTRRTGMVLLGASIRVTPAGSMLVFDTEACPGGFRMTAQAERLWAVVFGGGDGKTA